MNGYRFRFYVDGFNVYHAVLKTCPQYLWLNYWQLAQNILRAHDHLEKVTYFTAYANWKSPDVVRKHQEYVKVLRSAGVDTVHGRFMKKKVTCHLCHREFLSHEEKRTDVNIALWLVKDAFRDLFDKAVILSADSDLVPAIETVHDIAPGKEIGVMTPIGRESIQLVQVADFHYRMSMKQLAASQFPPEVKVGSEIIKRPPEWPLLSPSAQ